MIAAFLRLNAPLMWRILAIVVGASLIYAGHLIDVNRHEDRARREVYAKWDKQKVIDQAAALKAEEQYRANEAAWQANTDNTVTKYEESIRLLKASFAARSAADDGVRHDLAAIGASAGAAAQAPGAACRVEDGRIAVGADLLGEGYGLAGEGAEIVATLSAKVTALQTFIAGSCK